MVHIHVHTCILLLMCAARDTELGGVLLVFTYCLVWVAFQICLNVIAVHYEKVFHKLEVGKVVVGLVVEKFQVLFAYNSLHWLWNGGGNLECL